MWQFVRYIDNEAINLRITVLIKSNFSVVSVCAVMSNNNGALPYQLPFCFI